MPSEPSTEADELLAFLESLALTPSRWLQFRRAPQTLLGALSQPVRAALTDRDAASVAALVPNEITDV